MTIRKFGRYEVRRVLGQGGMAIVYLGYDPEMGREVAIKVLPSYLTKDDHFLDRFRREVKTIAQLEHPCIVPVYDYGQKANQPYIVMRYLSGGSLLSFLKKKPLNSPELVTITNRVARALDHAHAHNVIHCDLKPGNILFDDQDLAYLSDFGIAKVVGSTISHTGSAFIGTPSYMSPEQGSGAKNLDGRSDIYALGIIVFQALTGDLPYRADTPVALLMQHLNQEIPSILKIKPDLSPDYELVIRQALAKTPDGRYAKAGDLAEDLAKIARGERIFQRAKLQGDATEQIFPIPESEKPDQQKISISPKILPRLRQPSSLLLSIGLIITLILVGSGLTIFSGIFSGIPPTPTQNLISLSTKESPQIPTPSSMRWLIMIIPGSWLGCKRRCRSINLPC